MEFNGKASMDLFVKFVDSFIRFQDRWVDVFGGKLKIDEWYNAKIQMVRDITAGLSPISKLSVAASYLLRDEKGFTKMYEKVYNLKEKHFRSEDLLEIMSPYLAAKILLTLKYEARLHTYNKWSVHKFFGKGSLDGLYLITGRHEAHLTFHHFHQQFYDRVKSHRIIRDFAYQHLFVEDLLCEFHMFYRLFEHMGFENYNETLSNIINGINNGNILSVELSQYQDSELPYDEFQKQRVLSMTTKEGQDERKTV